MSPTQRILASEKRQRFFGHIRATDVLPPHHMLRVIRSKERYTPFFRAAVLRNLVCNAPVEVTHGRPYAERRRLVRDHYGV
ncbi:MAG: hypothetical protein EKK45_00310 [Curvibacter sp.]|nr:MAG: hypothetical protein EKK45_00310 [Curvibacter sp.]